MTRSVAILTGLLLLTGAAYAQERDTKVRNDRKKIQEKGLWIYNDLDKGFAEAKKTGRPMLVVFR